jgi:flagellar biosynthetic protein FliQ
MDAANVVDLAREALFVVLIVSAPMLLMVLVVGVLIGVLQAATSINEMTLSFIPKLVGLAAVTVVFGHWQLSMLVDYFRGIFMRIPGLFS